MAQQPEPWPLRLLFLIPAVPSPYMLTPWMCDLCRCLGSRLEIDPSLLWLLCCRHLEIVNNASTNVPPFQSASSTLDLVLTLSGPHKIAPSSVKALRTSPKSLLIHHHKLQCTNIFWSYFCIQNASAYEIHLCPNTEHELHPFKTGEDWPWEESSGECFCKKWKAYTMWIFSF